MWQRTLAEGQSSTASRASAKVVEFDKRGDEKTSEEPHRLPGIETHGKRRANKGDDGEAQGDTNFCREAKRRKQRFGKTNQLAVFRGWLARLKVPEGFLFSIFGLFHKLNASRLSENTNTLACGLDQRPFCLSRVVRSMLQLAFRDADFRLRQAQSFAAGGPSKSVSSTAMSQMPVNTTFWHAVTLVAMERNTSVSVRFSAMVTMAFGKPTQFTFVEYDFPLRDANPYSTKSRISQPQFAAARTTQGS